jgi:molybdopterin converting factor small subunit
MKGIFVMEIKVRLFATLRENRGKELYVTLSDSPSPRDLINYLGIKDSEVAILMVNGLDGKFDLPLKENDVVSIFPPVGGG